MVDKNEQHHPSFGNIRVVNVSGQSPLFGTTMQDSRAIRLEVSQGVLRDRNGQNMYDATDTPILVLEMSELQWARMVSSIGSYAGTPCTLRRRDGVSIAPMPNPKDIVDETYGKLKTGIDAEVKELQQALEEMTAIIKDGKMSKTLQETLQRQVDTIRRQLSDRLPFLGAVLEENVHKSVEEARSNIDAYVGRIQDAMAHEAARNIEGTLEHRIASGQTALIGKE